MDDLTLALTLAGKTKTTEERTKAVNPSSASIIYMVAVTASTGGSVILKDEIESSSEWEEGDYVEIDDDGDFEEYENEDNELEDVDDGIIDMTDGDGADIEGTDEESASFSVVAYQTKAQEIYALEEEETEEIDAVEDTPPGEDASISDEIDDGDATEIPDDGEMSTEDAAPDENASVDEITDSEYTLSDDNSDDESDEPIDGAEVSDGYTVAECIGSINAGDRVAVMVQDGRMVVLGVVGSGDAEDANLKLAQETADDAIVEVENIKAKNAEFENVITEKIEAVDARIGNLEVRHGEFEEIVTQDFEAVNGKIENLSGEFLSFKNGEFEQLKADHAEFKEVTTEELTAAKGWMAESSIGSAQISDLDANKIRSGTLDTSLVTVASKDSVVTITGNQLMVNDTTDALNTYNRVILGKYNKDENTIEYGLLIRSKDGQTIMLDGDGVHNAGITDGAIDNNKVADDANIEGKKLDINSVVREMNGCTEVISSTIIQVGDKELNVILEEQNNTITEQSEQLTTQKAQIEANQTAISLKVDSQTYTEDKAEMSESLSKATSDISVLQDQISLKVEQTDIDTALEGITVGARNLIRNSSTLDYIDYVFMVP